MISNAQVDRLIAGDRLARLDAVAHRLGVAR